MKHINIFLLLLASVMIGSGCSSSTTTAPVGNGPTINSFTVNPASITPGDSAMLAWSVDASATNITIDNGVGDVTSVTSVGVSPSSTTTYTLTAKNGNGSSPKSVTLTVSNPGDPGAPPKPQNLTANPNTGGVTLSWQASVGASVYWLERRINGVFAQTAIATGIGYIDNGLSKGTYSYRVRAVDLNGKRSAYSNIATAEVTNGIAVNSIALVPAGPINLDAGQTQQFTATAYDASGNPIPNISPANFSWNSSSSTAVGISNTGLATAVTAGGTAVITASIFDQTRNDIATSNPVTVAVKTNTTNTTLVIFHPASDPSESFAEYRSVLSGITFDEKHDVTADNQPLFTFEQIKGYSRIIFITSYSNTLSATHQTIFEQFMHQGGKTFVAFCESSVLGGTGALLDPLGVSDDGYENITNLDIPVSGGAGSVFEGLNFDKVNNGSYASKLTLASNGKAAFTGTLKSDGSQVIFASQSTYQNSNGLYIGITMNQIDGSKRQAIMDRILNWH